MILLVNGLPGSGKTSLCKRLLDHVPMVYLNADEIRADLNSDLGFSIEDRVENARRLGAVARVLSTQGHIVLVDFVNPTAATREAFGPADFVVWMDRISESRFADTNFIWEPPTEVDIRLVDGLSIESEVTTVIAAARLYDWKKPTTLMLGRYQPWHEGHDALYEEGLARTPQVVVAVRNTYGTSEKDPMDFEMVESGIRDYRPESLIMRVPNITNIIYGRDVGYTIEKVELSPELQAISATQKRKELGI